MKTFVQYCQEVDRNNPEKYDHTTQSGRLAFFKEAAELYAEQAFNAAKEIDAISDYAYIDYTFDSFTDYKNSLK